MNTEEPKFFKPRTFKLEDGAGRAKRLSLTILMLLICVNLYAQQTDGATVLRISPDEAVEMAFRNNLGLESSRVGLQTRQRASDLSWNQFIPNVTIAGSYTRDNNAPQGTTVGPITIPGGPQERFSVPFQVQLNLNVAMFENMRRLRLDYEGGQISHEKARAQLERDVRKAYHNILLIQENVALLRGSYENANRQVEIAQAGFNAGLMPQLSVLQAQVARANLRPIIDQAENGLRLSMAQFAMFLGLDFDTLFEFTPVNTDSQFIPLDITEMIRQASERRPDILELRQTILMMESARRAQVLALTPSLSLSWNTAPTFLGDPVRDWLDPAPGSLTVTLALRLHSLFPFSLDFQGIRNMDDQIRTANLGLAQLIHGTEIEIYNTILTIERIRTTVEAQAETVSLAEQSFLLTEEAYRAGLQDFFQVQNAEQSLHQARVQMLEQQFNYLNSLIDLEYTIGVPFGTLSGRN